MGCSWMIPAAFYWVGCWCPTVGRGWFLPGELLAVINPVLINDSMRRHMLQAQWLLLGAFLPITAISPIEALVPAHMVDTNCLSPHQSVVTGKCIIIGCVYIIIVTLLFNILLICHKLQKEGNDSHCVKIPLL